MGRSDNTLKLWFPKFIVMALRSGETFQKSESTKRSPADRG